MWACMSVSMSVEESELLGETSVALPTADYGRKRKEEEGGGGEPEGGEVGLGASEDCWV